MLATSATHLEALADGLQVVISPPLLAAQQAPFHDSLWAVEEQDEGRLNARLRMQADSAQSHARRGGICWPVCWYVTWLSKLERFSSLRGKPAQGRHWRVKCWLRGGAASLCYTPKLMLQDKQGLRPAPSMRNLRFPLSLIAFSNRLMVTCRGPAVRHARWQRFL